MKRIALLMACLIFGAWTNNVGKPYIPKNDFEKLAVKIDSFETECMDFKFDNSGKTTSMQIKKSPMCIQKWDQINQFMYTKMPILRSGEM